MGEKGLAEKSEDGSDTAEPDNEGPSHEADEPPNEGGVYAVHLGAEVGGMGLKSSVVGFHFCAKVSDVGLGGEVLVDRFESGEALFDGGHGNILA